MKNWTWTPALGLALTAALLVLEIGPARAAILENEPLFWWDFDNFEIADSSYPDLVEGVKLFEVDGAVATTTGLDGSGAPDFGPAHSYLLNTSGEMGIFTGAYAIELDVRIPTGPPLAPQYIIESGTLGSPTQNTQSIIYGFQGTELEMFGRPRTDGGPTTLGDGNWHKVVFGSYGNAAGTQGQMDKLVVSVDGGAPQVLSREGGEDLSRLDFRQLSVGHIIRGDAAAAAQR